MTAEVMPRVSILLSVYNGAEFLQQCLQSVFAQSLTDFELLVIDDGSSDASVSMLDVCADPRMIRVTSQGRAGLFPNLNRMAGIARAPLLKPWAQDDLMQPDCLSHAVQFHEAHPEVVISYRNLIELEHSSGATTSTSDGTPAVLPPADADWYMICHGSLCGNVSTLFIPTAAFARMRGFDNHISGDFGLLVKAAGFGAIGHIAHYDVVVRHHAAQWSRNRTSGLRTLISNAPLYETLLARASHRTEDSRTPYAHRVLAEVLGRTATPVLLKALLQGLGRETAAARGAISGFVTIHQMAWYFLRRLLGKPRRWP